MGMDSIGERVRNVRVTAGMSIDDLAYRSGVSHATISRIENGAVYPRPSTLKRLGNVLNTEINEFYPGTSPPKQSGSLSTLAKLKRIDDPVWYQAVENLEAVFHSSNPKHLTMILDALSGLAAVSSSASPEKETKAASALGPTDAGKGVGETKVLLRKAG
jgi:transcriptional regulator with XRE-family HTH domain